ncbi:MAG TPA: hypothetical protein VK607_04685 [Kofleriaceae bacterium]|nr:hypothetical protein [Kofleriaceae bacterium]
MRVQHVSFPELAIVAGTRGMLGLGIGLLAAERLRASKRRALGWTLVAIGAASTIPLALRMFQRVRASRGANSATDD